MTAPPVHSTPAVHRAHTRLLSSAPVSVVLVGCGGSGARMLLMLARLSRALTALGAPGLDVEVFDGDAVSEANLARQPYHSCDIGLNKAEVLVHRVNLTYGLCWKARPEYLTGSSQFGARASILISCVDTRRARQVVAGIAGRVTSVIYWMDLGNSDRTGQVVLGTTFSTTSARQTSPLPTCVCLWPEIADPDLDTDDGPSCSSHEALRRQDLFIGDVLTTQGINLLWRLFRDGEIRHHGAFCDLVTGHVCPIPVPTNPQQTRSR